MDYISRRVSQIRREGERLLEGIDTKRCSVCGSPAAGYHRYLGKWFCRNRSCQLQLEEEWDSYRD